MKSKAKELPSSNCTRFPGGNRRIRVSFSLGVMLKIQRQCGKSCVREGLKGGEDFVVWLEVLHSCCPNPILTGLKRIFLSFREIFYLSIPQSELCSPARFVVSWSNCVCIKVQPMNFTWNKAPWQRPKDAFGKAVAEGRARRAAAG